MPCMFSPTFISNFNQYGFFSSLPQAMTITCSPHWAYVCMPLLHGKAQEDDIRRGMFTHKKNNIAFKTLLLSLRIPHLCRSDKLCWPVAIFTCLQSHKLSCWATKDKDTFYIFSPPLFPIFNNTTCSQPQHICHPPAL